MRQNPLAEWQFRFVVLFQVDDNDTARVVNGLIRQVQQLPTGAMASLIWDRGSELTQHKRFTVATDVAMYFCDPRSPWQRGTHKNTNRLLRQYFPKGADLSQYTQQHLDDIALKLNTRPRRTLEFMTPGERFNQGCVDRLNSPLPLSRPGASLSAYFNLRL